MNLLIRISLIFNLVCANEIYQSIRVFQSSDQDIEIIAKSGIPLDHISGKQGIYIDLIATEYSMASPTPNLGGKHINIFFCSDLIFFLFSKFINLKGIFFLLFFNSFHKVRFFE